MNPLTFNPQEAIDILQKEGWTQQTFGAAGRQKCLHGAIRCCRPPKPGDEAIISAIMFKRGYDYFWNDNTNRTQREVENALAFMGPVTDKELQWLMGPDWKHALALYRRAVALLGDYDRQDEVREFNNDQGKHWPLAAIESDRTHQATFAKGPYGAAICVETRRICYEKSFGRDSFADRIEHPIITAATERQKSGKPYPGVFELRMTEVVRVLKALVCRHQIQPYSPNVNRAALTREITQWDYDADTMVWRKMFGPIHPDDPSPSI